MAKKMNRCLISLSVILMALSFAVAEEIHSGLKNAIDKGDYKMAKNLVEKVGVEDIYCPASLNVDDAEKIYAARDTFQIGRCFSGCLKKHLIDSSFFDRYMEKHCTSSAFVSKRICEKWFEYGDSKEIYDSFYKWFEEGKGVCQNVETMDFCNWLVRNTKDEYRMKFFRQLEADLSRQVNLFNLCRNILQRSQKSKSLSRPVVQFPLDPLHLFPG